MIRTAKRAIHDFPDTEFRAAMKTPIIVNMNFAARVTPHHDVVSEPMKSKRFVFDAGRLTHGVPHVLETEPQLCLKLGSCAQ